MSDTSGYFDTAPEEESQTEGTEQEGSEEEGQKDPASEYEKRFEDIQKELAEAKARADLAERLALESQKNYSSTPHEPESEGFDDLFKDLDMDEMTPEKLQGVVEAAIQRAVDPKAKSFNEAYTSLEESNARNWAELHLQNLEKELLESGHDDLIPEIRQQIKEWNIAPQNLASADNVRSVAYYLMGKRAYEEKLRQKDKSASPAMGPGGVFEGPPTPGVSQRELDEARIRWGADLTAEEAEVFGKDIVTLDDIEALEAKKQRKRG